MDKQKANFKLANVPDRLEALHADLLNKVERLNNVVTALQGCGFTMQADDMIPPQPFVKLTGDSIVERSNCEFENIEILLTQLNFALHEIETQVGLNTGAAYAVVAGTTEQATRTQVSVGNL